KQKTMILGPSRVVIGSLRIPEQDLIQAERGPCTRRDSLRDQNIRVFHREATRQRLEGLEVGRGVPRRNDRVIGEYPPAASHRLDVTPFGLDVLNIRMLEDRS